MCMLSSSFMSNFCDPPPMDCSPPGSSVHGISQARILEWVTISFSRDLATQRLNLYLLHLLLWQADCLPLVPVGKPHIVQWRTMEKFINETYPFKIF